MAKRKYTRIRRLADEKEEVVNENILKAEPEGQPPLPNIDKIVVMKNVPEYRRVTFLNGRDPGYPLDFHYHSATHPLKIYKLFHGKDYDLPIEIIEHLENRKEPQYAYRKGENGFQEHYICGYKYIFQLRNVPKNKAA